MGLVKTLSAVASKAIKAASNPKNWPAIRAGAKAVGDFIVKNADRAIGYVKKFVDIFRQNKISKEDIKETAEVINKQGSYDEQTATSYETFHMDETLSNIRKSYYEKLDNIENAAIDIIRRDIINEVIKDIENLTLKNDIEINIDSIQYEFEKLMREFRNSLSDVVIRNVSLSNRRFEDILSIKNDKDREYRIFQYIDKLVEDAIDEYFHNIDNITNKSLKIIEDSVNNKFNDLEKNIKNITLEIENNKKLKEEEIEPKRKEYENKSKLLEEFISILEIGE